MNDAANGGTTAAQQIAHREAEKTRAMQIVGRQIRAAARELTAYGIDEDLIETVLVQVAREAAAEQRAWCEREERLYDAACAREGVGQ